MELVKHFAHIIRDAAGIDARTVHFVCSTTELNRNGQVVIQDWKLDNYARNPVVLFDHDMGALPVGKASNVVVTANGLEADITFVSAAANPKAEQVYQLFKVGALNAVSVGFMPGSAKRSEVNGTEAIVLTGNELWEISIVPVPANVHSLAQRNSAALTTIQNLVQQGAGVMEFSKSVLALCGVASEAEAIGIVSAWKAAGERNAALTAENKTLRDAASKVERDAMIANGMRANQLTPAMKDWAEAQPIETLRAFLTVAPVVEPLANKGTQEPKVSNGANKPASEYSNMELAAMAKNNPARYREVMDELNASPAKRVVNKK